jgi:hypothetical protein
VLLEHRNPGAVRDLPPDDREAGMSTDTTITVGDTEVQPVPAKKSHAQIVVDRALLKYLVASQVTDGFTGKVLDVNKSVSFVGPGGRDYVVSDEVFDKHFTSRVGKDVHDVIDGRTL